jgi:hypothetical protein
MPDMSSDQIRDIAVRCVEGFFNDKISLSAGLAKEASANDLNLEQIKRASEVANTVCQLKLMQLSEDKTVEFPLCKVAEVMAEICMPESTDLFKQASVEVEGGEPVEPQFTASEVSGHERTLHFIKEASVNVKVLEQLQDRAIVLQAQLLKVAGEVKADPSWLDKMSSINTENFAELSVLVSGSVAKARDFGDHVMFKEAELKKIKTMAELYKEARSIVSETARRSDIQKRAEELTQELTKEAFITSLAAGVGKLIGSTMRSTGRVFAGTLGTTGSVARSYVGIGKSPSRAQKIGAAVALDAGGHLMSGGMGTSKNGAPKDVWDALQG